jgi:hypothetical protein
MRHVETWAKRFQNYTHTKIKSITKTVVTVKATIATIKSTIATIKSEITTLTKYVTLLRGSAGGHTAGLVTTNSTTYGNAGPTVSATVGTHALVIMSVQCRSAKSPGFYAFTGFSITGGTITTTHVIVSSSSNTLTLTKAIWLTGLTSGSTKTFTMKYKSSNTTNTTYFQHRSLTILTYP